MIHYLRLMNIMSLGNSQLNDQSNYLIKNLIHYLQIISIIEINRFTFHFEIPYSITILPRIIGEPIQSLKNAFDCSLIG
jgi:hypothetical protein